VAFEILAGMKLITPIAGAALHMLAATFVIFNSARLVRFGEEIHKIEPSAAAHAPRVEAVPAT
jgi:hypothetical protein